MTKLKTQLFEIGCMELKQKIHDALLMELIKTDNNGTFLNLSKLVTDQNFTVKCSMDVNDKGCVDVALIYPKKFVAQELPDNGLFIGQKGTENIAFELITDIDFDAGKKLEQVNRYKKGFHDVRVIMPKEYEIYAQLFVLNGIKVHTWAGIRRWKGKNCEHVTEINDSSEQPIKCDSCEKTGLFFVGFKDVIFK